MGGVSAQSSTTAYIAVFGSTGSSALSPIITANRSVAGLNFTAGAFAYTFANSGSFVLTIGSSGITNVSTNTQTFTQGTAISVSQSWSTDTGGLSLFNGSVNLNGTSTASRTLTVTGAGNTTFNGTVQNTSAGSTGNLTVTASGIVTLGGANTYNGTTTLNNASGTLAITGSSSSTGATTLTTGTLQLGGTSNGGLASGLLTLTGGTLQAVNQAATLANAVVFNAPTISGSKNLTLSSTVTAVTGASRTFTNNIASGSLLTLGSLSISNDTGTTARTLTLAGTGNTTISGAVDNGPGTTTANGFTITNTGTTTLSAANSYTGTTTISGGLVRLDHANALPGGVGATGGTSALTISGGAIGLTTATGDFTRAFGTGVDQVRWADSSSGGFAAFGGDRNLNFGGSGASISWSATNNVFGSNLILGHSTADSTITLVNPLALNITNGSRTVTVNDGAATLDAVFSGAVSGSSARLIKNGSGTLALTASNTFGSTLTAGTTFITINAGTLQLGNGGTTGSLTSSGTGDILNNGLLVANRSDALTLAHSIQGSGTFTQAGAGTTTLTGASTYNGVTTISAGTLQLGSGGTTGSLSATSVITNNGTLAVNRSNAVSQGTDFASTVGGSGNFTQTGSGTTTLTTGNTWSGTTTVSGGLLKLDGATALPGGTGASGTSHLIISGGIIGLTAASGDFTRALDTGATGAGNLVKWVTNTSGGFAAFGGDRSVNFGGSGASVTWSNASGILGNGLVLGHASADSTITVVNPISLANSGSTRTVTVNDGTAAVDAVMSGVISNAGTGFIKNGTGTLAMTAANTFGTTIVAGSNFLTVSAGTLQVGNGGTSGSFTATADISISAGGILATNRDGSLTINNAINNAATGSTILGGSSNIYSGGTSVSSGTLIFTNVSGSATGTGSVSVASGATLAGGGVITAGSGSSVTINGALSIGESSGTAQDMSISTSGAASLIVSSTGVAVFDLISGAGSGTLNGAAAADLLIVGGVMTLEAGSTLRVRNLSGLSAWSTGDAWKIIDWNSLGGSASGTFTSLDLPALSGPFFWDTSNLYSQGTLVVQAPEPSRMLLLAAVTVPMLLRRRR